MNPNRYFIPNMNITPFRNNRTFQMNNGLINRIINSIKLLDWKGLLDGANKTINVVNKTIPIIKETKPMINNMRSIISLTKAFNQETSKKKPNQITNKTPSKISTDNHNYPIFFV